MAKTPAPAQTAKAAKPPVNQQVFELTKDRDQYRSWWHQEREEIARLKQKLGEAEAALSAIRTVANAALPPRSLDDEIPF